MVAPSNDSKVCIKLPPSLALQIYRKDTDSLGRIDSPTDGPSVCDTPGGELVPTPQSIGCPFYRFVLVARGTGVGDFQGFRLRRRNETESVAAHVHVGNRLFDLWHVTSYAFISG